MWALITEAALGYNLTIPDWFCGLIVLVFLFCLPFALRRVIKLLFE